MWRDTLGLLSLHLRVVWRQKAQHVRNFQKFLPLTDEILSPQVYFDHHYLSVQTENNWFNLQMGDELKEKLKILLHLFFFFFF